MEHLHTWILVWNRTLQLSFGNYGRWFRHSAQPFKTGSVKDEEELLVKHLMEGFDLFCLLGFGIQTNSLK